MQPLTRPQLEAGLEHIRSSPVGAGSVEMIVARPEVDDRVALEEAKLDLDEGLVGDNWRARGSSSTADGSAHPNKQITLMNSRCVALLAQHREGWPLAGDQFYVDLD